MTVNVHNYIPTLMKLDNDAFTTYLDDLSKELSANVPAPFQWMISGSIKNATKPFVTVPERDQLFQVLLNIDLNQITHETVNHVASLIPTPLEDITVHIMPAVESKGGGCCYAPGKILLCIRCDELAPMRLKRNIAHEYSHTVRMIQKPLDTEHGYGEAVPYSMREYLAFEGLAMVLGETLYPHPAFPPYDVSENSEALFWEKVDLDTTGMDVYMKYMTKRAYEIASRIISQYLVTHNISIIEAHSKSDVELFWNSGYPYIR